MLQAENLHKTYSLARSRLHVLRGVSLKIDAGDVVAIVGPSGAGKSTLLHILGGLDSPSEGDVHLDGDNLYHLKENQRARLRNKKFGFIFQFYHLLPEFTALENIILPGLIIPDKDSAKFLRAKGEALLDRVGLRQRAGHKPNELSGGEQQRVAIARALINDPQVLLCDEPTGNLDSENGKAVIDLLLGLNEKIRQTVVIVTHDENIARRSHKVVHMKDGLLV